MRYLQLIQHIITIGLLCLWGCKPLGSAYAETVCSIENNMLWHKHALEYMASDMKLSSYGKEECADFLTCMENKNSAKDNLVKADGPTPDIILDLLNSGKTECVNIALVTIMIKGIYSTEIIEKILQLHKESTDVFSLFYSNHCLNNSSDKYLVDQETEIIQHVKKISNNAWLVMSIMPTLEKLPQEKLLDLYAFLLKKDEKAICLATFITISKNGDEYIARIKNILQKEGATDALSFIDQQQSK